jgi:hypothetical protein
MSVRRKYQAVISHVPYFALAGREPETTGKRHRPPAAVLNVVDLPGFDGLLSRLNHARQIIR